MFCFGAWTPAAWPCFAPASGMPRDQEQQRHHDTDRAGRDQRAETADQRDQRGHDRRRDRAAEVAGKGVDRKRASHPRFVHMRRQDRVVGRMVDAVGDAEQHGARDQPGIAQMQAEHDEGEAAQGQAEQQDDARADMVDDVAERRLGQAGDDREHGERKAELDIADAELFLQERKQHRQHQQVEMADPVGDRDQAERAKFAIGLCLSSWLVAVRRGRRPSGLKGFHFQGATISSSRVICP